MPHHQLIDLPPPIDIITPFMSRTHILPKNKKTDTRDGQYLDRIETIVRTHPGDITRDREDINCECHMNVSPIADFILFNRFFYRSLLCVSSSLSLSLYLLLSLYMFLFAVSIFLPFCCY
uniref:Uncharacterized protein n=1 Tax=Anopheles maculatus TaxID=74869 RepID=A0A182SZR8_9DIPT